MASIASLRVKRATSLIDVIQDINNAVHESKDANIEINVYLKKRGDFNIVVIEA